MTIYTHVVHISPPLRQSVHEIQFIQLHWMCENVEFLFTAFGRLNLFLLLHFKINLLKYTENSHFLLKSSTSMPVVPVISAGGSLPNICHWWVTCWPCYNCVHLITQSQGKEAFLDTNSSSLPQTVVSASFTFSTGKFILLLSNHSNVESDTPALYRDFRYAIEKHSVSSLFILSLPSR